MDRLIGVAFSNGTMLSVSDKSDSMNERTHELIKLHILGVWQNAYEFIRQPAITMSETPNLQAKEDNDKPRRILRHK